ncbi:MAG: hypothetical protein EBY40_07690 [Marivivens sp.]|nr:hypothetical protein [Marivivens sp.]NBT51355.1 hypothetical protein [Marivivens sp.]NCW68884.1 hypothetical protein [Marivivens sp.]NDH02996.1 hypothetical protein [Marivivens sp.]
MKTAFIAFAVVFAAFGTACNFIDAEDHWPVGPTEAPPGLDVAVPQETQSINEAERSLEDFVTATDTYKARRGYDIEKQRAKLSVLEGIKDGGLQVLGEQVGAWAGPFAPLLMLFAGYKTKRRGDMTPDEAKAAAAKEKEDSYNAGLQAGQELAKRAIIS